MMRKGRFLVFFGVFLLVFSGIVCAVDLDVEVFPVKDTVFKDEEATFIINITNEQDKEDRFKVSSLSLNWILEKDLSDLKIGVGKTENYLLVFKALGDVKPGKYGVVVTVTSKTDEEIKLEKILEITLVDENNLVDSELVVPDSIDPRKKINMKIKVKNNYNLILENLKVRAVSSLFEKERKLNLNKSEEKELDFTLELNPNTQDGRYNVEIFVYRDEELIGKDKTEINIAKYPGVREIVTPNNAILVWRETVEKINEGNSVEKIVYSKEFGWFAKLFTKSDPEPSTIVKKEGKYILKWEFDLNPEESKSIYIKTSYRLLVLGLIILIVICALLYEFFRREIKIDKKILTKIKTKENIAKIKVVVGLKNKSGKEFRNLKLMDRIPSGSKAGEYGTIEPDRIIKGVSSLNLIWKIPILRGKEERVISYSVEIPLKKGKMKLPCTLVKYHRGKRSLISRSGLVSFSLK
jgi:hypothetical protein